jgi:hypothetical protein
MAKFTVAQALQMKEEFELMGKELKNIAETYKDKLSITDKTMLDVYASKSNKFAKLIYDTVKNQWVEL